MKPSTSRALAALQHGQWTSGNELARVCGWRFSARLFELRAAGYRIERRSSRTSAVDDYRLVVEPVHTEMGLAS